MRWIKVSLIICLSLIFSVGYAQMVKDESKWSFEAKKKSGNAYQLIVHCKMPKNWHIYAFKPGGDGTLIPPVIKFKGNGNVKLAGPVTERGKLLTEVLEGIDGKVNMYKENVDYVQNATVTGNAKVTGTYMYQICNDQMCLPPTADKPFSIEITDAGGTTPVADTTSTETVVTETTLVAESSGGSANPKKPDDPTLKAVKSPHGPADKKEEEKKSLLWLFLAAFLGGLAAVLTPCVYSMIPITVSFFTKRSKTRKE